MVNLSGGSRGTEVEGADVANIYEQLIDKFSKDVVNSLNGKTGNVSIAKEDVGLSQVANVKQYSAKNPPPYPVTSVNGQTGAVTVREVPAVTASDNGKFLRVVSGAWAIAAINNANGGSF